MALVEQVLSLLEHAGVAISLFAVLVLVVGFVLTLFRNLTRNRSLAAPQRFKEFKIGLGRTLTLSLEILVFADIIETITVKPTFSSLGFLAVLVALRTVMIWTLTLEIEGRWPWQPANPEQGDA